MFSKLSGNITEQLIENGTIKPEDKDIYSYGVEQSFVILMNLVTTLVIGLCFGMIWQSIIYMIIYLPLRSFAGGYHARTVLRCYIFGIILAIADLSINKLIPATDLVISIMTLLAGIIIFILAPVETANKPLDHTELSVYRKRTRIILLSDICIITILLAFDLNSIALCIGVALMVLSFMVVLGKMNQDAVTSWCHRGGSTALRWVWYCRFLIYNCGISGSKMDGWFQNVKFDYKTGISDCNWAKIYYFK